VRVAVVGSGGAGKSVISGLLARLLARSGRRVLAVDLDPNPGLAWSIGVTPSDEGLPEGVVTLREGGLYGWGLAEGIDPAEGAERFSTPGPDGVRYLCPGKIDRADHAVSHSLGAVQAILDATDASWDIVGDIEAGTTCPYEGYTRFADQVVVVVTQAWRSGLAGHRLSQLLAGVPLTVVGSQLADGRQPARLDPAIRVPFDPAVARAERLGMPTLDACPNSPVVGALRELVGLLLAKEAALDPLRVGGHRSGVAPEQISQGQIFE
jgi:CO dehydrogenase maturation factor